MAGKKKQNGHLERILNRAPPAVHTRARDYLVRGQIGISERIQNTWMGFARGQDLYALTIDLYTGKSSCTCPAPRPCKHLVAFALLLKSEYATPTESELLPGEFLEDNQVSAKAEESEARGSGSSDVAGAIDSPQSALSQRKRSKSKSAPENKTTSGKSSEAEIGVKKPGSKSAWKSEAFPDAMPGSYEQAEAQMGNRKRGSLPLCLVLNEQTEKLRLDPGMAMVAGNLEDRLIPEHATFWTDLKKRYPFPYQIPLSEVRNWQDLEASILLKDLNGRDLDYLGELKARPALRGFSNRLDARRVLVPFVTVKGSENWLKPGQTSLIEPGSARRQRSFWLIDYSELNPALEQRMHSVLSPEQIIESASSFAQGGVSGLDVFQNVYASRPRFRISLDHSIDTDLWLHGELDLVYARSEDDFNPDYLEKQPHGNILRPVYRSEVKLASVWGSSVLPGLEEVEAVRPPHYTHSEEGHLIWRQPAEELEVYSSLKRVFSPVDLEEFYPEDASFTLSGPYLYEFLTVILPQLIEAGIIVEFNRELARLFKPAPRARIRIEKPSGIDWFSGKINLPGMSRAEQEQIFTAYKENRPYAQINKGNWINIAESGLEELAETLRDLGIELDSGGSIALRRSHWMALESELAEQLQTRTRSNQLKQGSAHQLKCRLAKGFKGKLRKYQREGLEYLINLYNCGTGGLLADEMGLGKTVQALAFLYTVLEQEKGLILVVCPVSALSVWEQEARRFCPDIPITIWHGSQRRQRTIPDSGLLISTFATIQKDISHMSETSFSVTIVDEAQNVRNARTEAARSLRKLNTRSVFCLTGTPMENHLMDYWSLLDLSVPGLLGTRQSFARRFDSNPDRIEYLRRLTAPFILRRTKDQVIQELPGKTEIQSFLPMERKQAAIYESVRQEAVEFLKEAGSEYLVRMLPYLMRLRRIACHPHVADVKSDPLESGKFAYLKELLYEIHQGNSAALIFSQFTDVLDVAGRMLESMDLEFFRIDGSTSARNRAGQVQRFQEGERSFFLISLKAGGTALTLHRADRVIHLDPWWNPAAESQATDRAHRIGQKKHLFVYKLFAKDTVEQRVLELQEKKRALFNSLFSESPSSSSGISRDELLRILDD